MIRSILNTFIVVIITGLGGYVYINVIDPSISIDSYYNSINENILFIVYILMISFISQYLYSSSQKNKDKELSISLSLFKYLSHFIRVSSVVIAINSLLIDNLFGYEFHDSITFVYIGISLSAISISLFISAKISLGVNYSDCYSQKTPKKIVNTGLYSIIRHPIYSSNILLVISVLIISGSYLIIINLILISLFYVISAFREERYLINRFSNYNKYSKKTGMFVPKYWK